MFRATRMATAAVLALAVAALPVVLDRCAASCEMHHDTVASTPIRGLFPAGCTSAVSGTASRLRVSIMMPLRALHHIVISSHGPHADLLLAFCLMNEA